LELLKLAADQGNIVIVFSHDSLQGPRLGDRMVRLHQERVKPIYNPDSRCNGLADGQP
jgi:ABC-type Mn2+/Zn2+ transport system ATPase subunit